MDKPLASSLGQVALPVTDPDRAEAFYRDVLGLALLYRFGDLVFFDLGGFAEGTGVRLLLEPGEPLDGPSRGCLYLRVTGIEAAAAELARRGVALTHAPRLIARMPDHELWMAFFNDPDGHTLALMEEQPKG